MSPCAPSDDELVQKNARQILAAPDKLYDHRLGKLDALTILEAGISDRKETIQQHKRFYGFGLSEWSRAVVGKSQHEIRIMERILQRLYSAGLKTPPLARQLRRERECPPPTMRELLVESTEKTRLKLPRRFAKLLDLDTHLMGVTVGKIRPELVKIAVVTRLTNDPLNLSLTAGWGHGGKGGVTMPGRGKFGTRGYTAEEAEAINVEQASRLPSERPSASTPTKAPSASPAGAGGTPALLLLGQSTHDVYLNDTACWRNVPERVWGYTIGGYQVMKKWLSYREHSLLGRALTPDEAREVTHTARRLAALILLQPELDASYQRVKAQTFAWKP